MTRVTLTGPSRLGAAAYGPSPDEAASSAAHTPSVWLQRRPTRRGAAGKAPERWPRTNRANGFANNGPGLPRTRAEREARRAGRM